MFLFWYRWLIAVTFLVIVFGLEMAFLNQSVLFEPVTQSLGKTFWQTATTPDTIIPFQALMFGALGATTAGWGLMIMFLLHNSFKNRERWSWWAIALSVDLWYVVDTTIAWQLGAMVFVVLNTALVVAMLPALLATYAAFKQTDVTGNLLLTVKEAR